MFEKNLKYMMSNNAEETLSERGSNIRKKIRPLFLKFLKLGNKLKLVIEKNEFQKTDRPVIYVASHGFKDDVLNTILSLKDDAYIVFGNIDLFFKTFDGLCLWIYGTQLVNRYDKASRNAMKKKMDRILKLGNNIVIFPEATWNLSPNRLMENLHWGFYEVASKNNALIVPVVTHKVGNKCFSRILSSMDLKEIDVYDVKSIAAVMKKYIDKAYDLLIYTDFPSFETRKIIDSIKSAVGKLTSCSTIEQAKMEISNVEILTSRAGVRINELKDEIGSDEKLENAAFQLISKLVSRTGTAKKEIFVNMVRDIMALEKYDMILKNPDCSYMRDGKSVYEAWDDYIKDTISATPYFYPESEKTTLFKDELIKDEKEVMPWKPYYESYL